MCAVQAAMALAAIAGAGIGLSWLDPVAALAIAAIALKESRDGWGGESACCAPMPGPATDASHEDCCVPVLKCRLPRAGDGWR